MADVVTPPERALSAPSNISPVIIINTLMFSHCRKVLSLAKNVFGSTLQECSNRVGDAACTVESTVYQLVTRISACFISSTM